MRSHTHMHTHTHRMHARTQTHTNAHTHTHTHTYTHTHFLLTVCDYLRVRPRGDRADEGFVVIIIIIIVVMIIIIVSSSSSSVMTVHSPRVQPLVHSRVNSLSHCGLIHVLKEWNYSPVRADHHFKKIKAIPCTYFHARWSYRRQLSSLLF